MSRKGFTMLDTFTLTLAAMALIALLTAGFTAIIAALGVRP